MKKLELTDTERLLLANQYEILGLLKQEPSYKRLAENLRDGHKWLYEDHVIVEENLSDAEALHVLSVLKLYDDLQSSYRLLTAKGQIKQRDVEFPGFDGNHESRLLRFARSLHKMGHYAQTMGGGAPNSHMETTDMYKRQLAQWNALGMPTMPFTHDQICRIVEAREHPSHVA